MSRRGRLRFKSAQTFFVTTTVVNFAAVFREDRYCEILVRNIKHYQQRYRFRILAYVIMPSHFHWVVHTDPKIGTISDIMRDIKKYSAWDIMSELESAGQSNLIRMFEAEAGDITDQRRKFWMRRFDDRIIRSTRMLRTVIEYIHRNPVKAGLVDGVTDYKYSSARNYLLNDHSMLEVITDWI